MVLVGNEWQNKCEDVPKTTINTTTTEGPNTTTEPTTSLPVTGAAGSISEHTVIIPGRRIEDNHNCTETDAGYLMNSATDGASIIKDNAIDIAYESKLNNDDGDADFNESKIIGVDQIFAAEKNVKGENLEQLNLSPNNNNLKIMAENTKEFAIKEANEDQESQPQALINNHYAENNKDIVETASHYNANTNTLTLAPQRENNREQSALQTALNAFNNANISVAAAGLQPNFLSQLALTANVAGLQKSTSSTSNILTAKQLNQSFNMLDSNNQHKNDSNLLESNSSTISVPAYGNNGQAKIVLICEDNSHPFQTRSIWLTPNVECMVGRLIAKSKASENNAIFDCKVLSRKHAVIWYSPDGKFWVKDTKSSNGTFINDNKLGDEEAELEFGDIVKFGVDVLENSRKEVHGCIIACVELYVPDGRESISIESSGQRHKFSGDGRISYDELHRLNLYIQETTQREKVLTSKLCNIQNVLDSTRKKSALCWQSMITEDQLLHRIQTLEKKLQFMEKNVPENVLRNEVLKLLDEKSSYQHTAKEALRKVYQERCEAMQMLANMELAYSQSDNECSVLRDQIMNCKQTLQDVNTRLLGLETEYNDYKDEVARQQQEMKDRELQHIIKLKQKLREREYECEDLNKKISDILIKRAELFKDEEQLLEKQAFEKLDAAIADMDLGDNEDSSDDENEVDGDVNDIKSNKNSDEEEIKHENKIIEAENDVKFAMKIRKPIIRPQVASIFDVVESCKLKNSKIVDCSKSNKTPPKRVKETTIMKWLQNSDINKNEGSRDIFKAICNENEDDTDLKDSKCLQISKTLGINETTSFSNFRSKLKNVQINLKQLEAEIQSETNNEICVTNDLHVIDDCENVECESSDEEDNVADIKGACAENEFIIKKHGNTCIINENQVLSKENNKYLLLKSSVDMLREAYNEIWNSVKEKDVTHSLQNEERDNILSSNFKSCNSSSTTIQIQLDSPTTLRSLESDNAESYSEVESGSLSSPIHSSLCGTVIDSRSTETNDYKIMPRLKEYQSQIETLNEKLQSSEMDAQHTLEIMQVECDDLRLKVQSLNEIIEGLKIDKNALQQVINGNQNNLLTAETKAFTENHELEEDSVLNAINVTALEREEELITYKERLDEQQKQNIVLRNEIALFKQKTNSKSTKNAMLREYLPYFVFVLAIIIYFITTYY